MKVVTSIKSKMQQTQAENPFYGKSALLALMQHSTKDQDITPYLSRAWVECKGDKTLREAFFVILFSIGDISNRDHNIFRGRKVDNGGNSLRGQFMNAMQWMVKTCPEQYQKFLSEDLFRQYSCLFNVLGTQVRTQKGSKTIVKVINMLDGVNLMRVAEYLAKIINGSNPVERTIIAKWLVNPRTSKRQGRDRKTGEKKGGRELQDATKKIMEIRVELYKRLSQVMNWPVIVHKHNTQFTGMRDWKKLYNGSLESVLFSSGMIRDFDENQFTSWLNSLPSGARYRVRRRLLNGNDKSKGKWKSKFGNADMGQWILNWEAAKDKAQQTQRELEEKVRQGDKSEETQQKLKEVKKEAKVTTGGETIFSIFEKMINGNLNKTEFNQTAQSILDKVKFEVPVLLITDRSSSMSQYGMVPIKVAQLVSTIVMLKNPSDELDNIVVTFGDQADFITDGGTGTKKENRFMQGKTVKINKLVDRTAEFTTNLNTVGMVVTAKNEATHFSSVSHAFKSWLDSAPLESDKQVRREMIQNYPVFLVISDGDLNNASNATQSMAQFQQNMLQWFGWSGVIVVWNVNADNKPRHDYFEGLQNVIHYYGYNAGIVNTIFTKIHDLDIIDIYTPLKSLHASNRYQPIKNAVL